MFSHTWPWEWSINDIFSETCGMIFCGIQRKHWNDFFMFANNHPRPLKKCLFCRLVCRGGGRGSQNTRKVISYEKIIFCRKLLSFTRKWIFTPSPESVKTLRNINVSGALFAPKQKIPLNAGIPLILVNFQEDAEFSCNSINFTEFMGILQLLGRNPRPHWKDYVLKHNL